MVVEVVLGEKTIVSVRPSVAFEVVFTGATAGKTSFGSPARTTSRCSSFEVEAPFRSRFDRREEKEKRSSTCPFESRGED